MSNYVLLTAAHNEEADIGRTIESVIAQNVRPARWVIVSDNSSDRTDEIAEGFSHQHEWIRFLKVTRDPGRSFASKVIALRRGEKLLEGVNYDYLGVVDGDVTFEADYFQRLLERFRENPQLGIAGGFVQDLLEGQFQNRPGNSSGAVAHAGQLVRRECYEAIGGYAVLKYGGEDWHALVSAQMKGWRIEAFPDLKIFHYRPTGTKGNHLDHIFRQGRMDYAFGSYILFEVLKCAGRIPRQPLLIGALTRLMGFGWAAMVREQRPVTDEFVSYVREGQKDRLRKLVGRKPLTSNSCS